MHLITNCGALAWPESSIHASKKSQTTNEPSAPKQKGILRQAVPPFINKLDM